MCVHDWQPIPGWFARYRCSICRVIGWKPRMVTLCRAHGTEIEPYRCEIVRDRRRCKAPAVFAKDGKHFRCEAHRAGCFPSRARARASASLRSRSRSPAAPATVTPKGT